MSTVSQVAFVLMVVVVASGCANYSLFAFPRPVTRPETQMVQAEAPASSRSDRLRDQHAQASSSQVPERSALTADTPTPARSPEPANTQEQSLPQQPPRSSEAPPPQRANEPDPRDVIDWLLKR